MRIRSSFPLLLFGATLALAETPVPLAPAASSPPGLAAPESPVRLSLAAGEPKASYLGKASSDRPATILITLPAHETATIGVSSPGNVARLVLYAPDATTPLQGTSPQDGAIRWMGRVDAPGDLRAVVVMPGAETPFRIEVSRGGIDL